MHRALSLFSLLLISSSLSETQLNRICKSKDEICTGINESLYCVNIMDGTLVQVTNFTDAAFPMAIPPVTSSGSKLVYTANFKILNEMAVTLDLETMKFTKTGPGYTIPDFSAFWGGIAYNPATNEIVSSVEMEYLLTIFKYDNPSSQNFKIVSGNISISCLPMACRSIEFLGTTYALDLNTNTFYQGYMSNVFDLTIYQVSIDTGSLGLASVPGFGAFTSLTWNPKDGQLYCVRIEMDNSQHPVNASIVRLDPITFWPQTITVLDSYPLDQLPSLVGSIIDFDTNRLYMILTSGSGCPDQQFCLLRLVTIDILSGKLISDVQLRSVSVISSSFVWALLTSN